MVCALARTEETTIAADKRVKFFMCFFYKIKECLIDSYECLIKNVNNELCICSKIHSS
jgi:hypothetical protein